jgi:Tfp pilus assembly protein PilF
MMEKGDLNGAERIFRKTLQGVADRGMAYAACSNLGLLYARQGKDWKAIAAFTRAIEFRPDAPEACHRMGLVFARRKNPAGARKFFKVAPAVDPSLTPARERLAQLRKICESQP